MWSALARRVTGLQQSVRAAKKVAPEMIEIHGEGVWLRLRDLESKAWQEGKITEYYYWRLVGEYVRDLTKLHPKDRTRF